jgi:hypothetical protein
VLCISPGSGKHLSGHLDRTVYISGVPASCPRQDLLRALEDVLETSAPQSSSVATMTTAPPETASPASANINNSSAQPSSGSVPGGDSAHLSGAEAASSTPRSIARVLLAQPMWRARDAVHSFERSAWVVLRPDAPLDVPATVKLLRETRLPCPGPVDLTTGLASQGFSYRVMATQHSLRSPSHSLPAFLSSAHRVHADIARALRLAALLDEDRSVPSDCRLSRLLSPHAHPELLLAMQYPTELLDVALAYLRRVHFVSYYTGARFRDEAHMLSNAPNVISRSVPFHGGSLDSMSAGAKEESSAEDGTFAALRSPLPACDSDDTISKPPSPQVDEALARLDSWRLSASSHAPTASQPPEAGAPPGDQGSAEEAPPGDAMRVAETAPPRTPADG